MTQSTQPISPILDGTVLFDQLDRLYVGLGVIAVHGREIYRGKLCATLDLLLHRG